MSKGPSAYSTKIFLLILLLLAVQRYFRFLQLKSSLSYEKKSRGEFTPNNGRCLFLRGFYSHLII